MAAFIKTMFQRVLANLSTVDWNTPTTNNTAPEATSGTFTYELCDLEPGTVVKSVEVLVSTAFNAGTGDDMYLGDSLDPNRYMVSTSVKTVGSKTTLITGFVVPSTGLTLKLVRVWSGTVPTAGRVEVVVSYAVKGRADEVFKLPVSV